MKSSGISSAANPIPSPSPAAPSRKRFALTGRSRDYDPRTTAARADIADVRLAEQVFAPHYAAPMDWTVVADAPLMADRDGPEIARLTVGERFEALDVTARHVWGVARPSGLVGYAARDALRAD